VLTVAVMIGVLGLFDWPATVISSNFTALLFIITMSMAIHVVVRYRELAARDPERDYRDLVFEAACLVAKPCFYCALTTMVGFGSLVVSGIRPVEDFGLMMTVGIGVAYAMCFLFFPALLALLRKPSEAATSPDQGGGITGMLARVTDRHAPLVLILAVVVVVAGSWGVSRLTVENKFIDYFKSSTEIYQGMKLIDEQLGGTAPLEIILEGEGSNAWFRADQRARIRQVHDFLDQLPETGKVLSLDSPVRVVEKINGDQPINDFLFNMIRGALPADLKEAVLLPYVNEDASQTRIEVRVRETYPGLQRDVLLNKIERFLQDEMGLAEQDYRITGIYVLYNNLLQSLFNSQIRTIVLVFAAVWLMFAILFRSLILATIGLVPNVFPVVLVLGILGWVGIPLDIMTITIAAITIGIAVDQTIHYIHRFQREYPREGSYVRTMYRCHDSIGKAMYYTSLTIILGFSLLVLSNFKPTIYFGLFTGLAMVAALLGSMTLLPRLIIWLKPLGPERTKTET
jgi:hypothetical protein